MDPKSLSLPQNNPKGHAFLLFAARAGVLQSGVVLHVDEVNYYKGQIQTGADYLGKIKRQWPRQYYNEQTVSPCAGLTLYRMDYLNSANDYNSAVVGVFRAYVIVFKFNADSQERLNALVSSINNIRLE